MLTQIGLAALIFAVTNLDDLLILSIYFANPEFKTRNIVIGQYAGILCLVIVSSFGLVLGTVLPDHWISALGLIPIGLGLKGLLALRTRHDVDEEHPVEQRHRYQWLFVAGVTIANGGDNIGVYTPVFANLTLPEVLIFVLVFLLLTATWCFIASRISRQSLVRRVFSKYGKIILPVFLVALGAVIAKGFFVWVVS